MHNNNIGTLRFIGAFMVLFGHGYNLCGGIHGALDPVSRRIILFSPFHKALPGLGVMLFFVISGYLITASFMRRTSLSDYCASRILRIYPALISAVFFCVFIVGLSFSTLPAEDYMTHRATWNFLFFNSSLIRIHFKLPGVFESLPWKGGINGSLWTLPIEMWMYILVAGFGVLGIIKNNALFNALAVFLILIFFANPETFPLLFKSAHAYLGLSFLIGSVFYVNRDRLHLNRLGFIILLVGAAVSWKTAYYHFMATLGFGYFVLMIGLHPKIRLPRLDRFGDFSYGLYLYAFPMQQISIHYFGGSHPMLINLTAFLGAMVMATISWFFIEKPALSVKPVFCQKMKSLNISRCYAFFPDFIGIRGKKGSLR